VITGRAEGRPTTPAITANISHLLANAGVLRIRTIVVFFKAGWLPNLVTRGRGSESAHFYSSFALRGVKGIDVGSLLCICRRKSRLPCPLGKDVGPTPP
jgi:hypothetical protein